MSERHAVYRALDRRLTIWGVERKVFFVTALTGAATFQMTASLLGGLLMFGVLFALARLSTAADPQMIRLLLNSTQWRIRYDPGKFVPHSLVLDRHDHSSSDPT